jgi:hypothetical protein
VFDEPAVPGEDGGRLRNGSDLLKRFLAQLLTNRRQALALSVRQPHAALQLLTQNPVFHHQVSTYAKEIWCSLPTLIKICVNASLRSSKLK